MYMYMYITCIIWPQKENNHGFPSIVVDSFELVYFMPLLDGMLNLTMDVLHWTSNVLTE